MMHPFSNFMKQFLQSRDVTKASLCTYLNMDRSTLHKILKGSRIPPSLEVVDSIASFLSLSPEEHQSLTEAWKFEKTGPLVYYRRRHAAIFLKSHLPKEGTSEEETPDEPPLQAAPELPPLPESHCLLRSRSEILQKIQTLLTRETSHPEGRIALMFQPDQSEVLEQIRNLKTPYPYRMDHILCLSKIDTLDRQNRICNLNLLTAILPVFRQEKVIYRAFYHYDDVDSLFSAFNGMPCLFLTSEEAITCTPDYQTGILYTNKEILRIFWDLFRKCRQSSSELVRASSISDVRPFLAKDYTVYIPAAPAQPLSRNLFICINRQQMAMIYKKWIYVIQEISILTAFMDYLQLPEEDCIYTSDSGNTYITELWRELCPNSPSS